MKKKIFWKDIRKSFGTSKGRFLSIMLLMMLGSFALTGLKVTSPNMERTATQYLKKHNTMDISLIASAGLSEDDQKELDGIKNASVSYGYMSDVTIKNTDKAVRVFSNSPKISTYEIVSGKLPKSDNEIALASTLKNDYKLGTKITFTQPHRKILRQTTYTIVGFVNSSEIWSKMNMGASTAGNGDLSAYAVVNETAFKSDVYTIARLRYDNLKELNPYSDTYIDKLNDHQEYLDKLLSDNGSKRLNDLKSQLQSSVNQAQKQIDNAKIQLAQQEKMASFLSGSQLSEAQKAITKAKASLKENQEKVTASQNRIDSLEAPTYNSYTRPNIPGGQGYHTYSSISKNINNIGNLFPVVLYLVAALVTFTTMTRFVNEERNNSGILKALGYSNSNVVIKFVIYGFIASLLGTIFGIFGGHYILPRIVTRNVSTTMTIGSPHLYFYWFYALLALILSFVSAVLPAFLVAQRELSEKPAQLLLPKPPVKGSKILLEHVTFLWRKLSFTQKVTARNIFRYKQRMFMTIFGVSGSVALLFAGLGIQSSLGKVVDNQFKNITTYDILVMKNLSADSKAKEEVNDFLESSTVSNFQKIYFQNIEEKISGQSEKKTVSIITTTKNDFRNLINLKNNSTHQKIKLTDEGVVISEKLAQYYGVQKGDYFIFQYDKGKNHQLKVADITEMNVGNYLFMKNTYYQKIFNDSPKQNAILVNLKNDTTQNISKQATKLLGMSGIANISQNSSLIKMVDTAVKGLNASMTILIIVSVLLATVILYNLTNINVSERIRELSTIKVLGFHNKEVTMYIYRETISLSIIGITLGLVGGYYLHDTLITMMSRDTMYPKEVDWSVYIIPIVTISILLIILGWIVNHRLKTVDMLEALKSVD